MKKSLHIILLFTAVGLIAGYSGCLEEVPEELTSPLPQIPIPHSLTATISDDSVTLAWLSDDQYDYSGFAIFRSEVNITGFEKIGTSPASPYGDGTIHTGRVYEYRVAGLDPKGIEGRRSEPLLVQASFFGVTINGSEERTRERAVQLFFTAPVGTQNVMFSDSPTLAGADWQTYAPSYPFIFPAGDGLKIIYARFTDEFGHLTDIYSDTIVLDTQSSIESLSYSPASPVSPGETMHFQIVVAGAETGGTVYVVMPGLGNDIDAKDDGTEGDLVIGDGTYERDYTLPSSFRGLDILITAVFVDEAGNQSDEVEFSPSLDMTDPPSPVRMLPVTDSTITTISLRWTESDDVGFESYDLYRDDQTGVNQALSTLVTSLRDQTATLYTDQNVIEGETYHYAVFVVNDLDESAKSLNEIVASTEDTPPSVVVLDTVSSVGTDRLTLNWSRNESTDFREYRVYQATAIGVDTTDTLVGGAFITDRFRTFLDVQGLNMSVNTYYFRVYVFDKTGQFSRSNEVSTE